VGRTLHNILAEVLLCIMAAMGLTVSCLPRGTCCRCYPMFVSTTAVVLSGAEAAMVVATIVEAFSLTVHALAGEGFLLLAIALLGLLFLVQSATT
jgi:hypothetical protein